MALGPDSTHLLDQGTFPEVQYPLTTMETWEPKYWNCLPFNQDEKQFNSFQRDTFKPNVKKNKQLTRLTKTKENKFLKSYEVLKGKHERTSTENSKRSSTGEQGLNFTKTATCEKVTDEFISAGLVSTLPKNTSVSKTALERDNITKMENKCEITDYSLDLQLDTNKKVDDLENMCLPLEIKNNTDESKELINIINEILKLESIEDETETTESASNSSTEKSTDTLDMAINNSTNDDVSPTSIDDTSSYKDANASEELLMTEMTNDELVDEMPNTTLPLPSEPERDNITCVENTSNATLPLSIAQNVTTNETLTNTSSTNPTEASLLSNSNAVPGSTSIIIIPISNNLVGKSQSHIISGTPDKPIILYIPSQTSDIHTQNLLSEQQISLSLEKFMQDNLGNDLANMTLLQNLSSNDLVGEIINFNSHNGSSLPINETLPINSMCYNNENNLSSIAVIESASLEPDNNEEMHKQSEDLNSEILSGETLPQTPDFEHPLLDFSDSEFALLSHGPFNDNLSSELPLTARQIDLDHEICHVSTEDLCIEKHNVLSETFHENEDVQGLEETIDEDSVTPLTYIDGENLKSDKNVLPASDADDTEIIKEVPLSPEIEQYSMPVSNDELTSSSTEEPANIIEPSPVDLFKSAEVSVPLAISFESNPIDLRGKTTTQFPLMQKSHETTDNAQQPMNNSASLPSTSNNLPITTDTKLESALLPEFQKISLLLDKMLSRFETFTTNTKIVPVSEHTSSSQPLTTSQVPIHSLPLPVDKPIKFLEGTETQFDSFKPSLSASVPSNQPIASLKYSLPLSLDEPNDPYSLLKPSTIPTQPTVNKMPVTTPIKEPQPNSQISSDSIILTVDNMFKPQTVMESPLQNLQEINQPLSSTPEFEPWNYPSSSLVNPSDSPSKPSYETLSLILDSNSFQSIEGSQLPISKTYIDTIEQRTNQLHQSTPLITSGMSTLPLTEPLSFNSLSRQSENTPVNKNNDIQPYLDSDRPIPQVSFPQWNSQIFHEDLCLPINKTLESEVAEAPIQSPELKMVKYCPVNSLRIQTQSEPNNLLHTTADSYHAPLSSKETQPISQTTGAQCLPLNITSPTIPEFGTSVQSSQQQADKPVPSTLINDALTNDRCPVNHTSHSTNSVLESDSTPLDEICPLTPTSETATDYQKSNNDNLIGLLSQSYTAKASHFHGSIVESSDVPLKMNLLIPDTFEDTRDDSPITVNIEPTVNSRTATEKPLLEMPETITSIPEFPVCEQSNATDMLSAKIALDNVTSDERKYNLPENNLILDGLTQEALSIDDSPLITNDTITEIPNSDDIQQVLPQNKHLLPVEENIRPEFSVSELASLNKDQQPVIDQIDNRVLDGLPEHRIILLSGDSLDDIPSRRNKPYSTSTIGLTKALLKSLLSEIEKIEFSTPASPDFSVKPAKLIDQTEEVEPSLSGMTQSKFPEDSSSEEDKTQSDLDLSTDLTDNYKFSESEDLLTLPVDNTHSEIPNLDSSEDNTPQIDETHEDESDITTDEVFHKEIDILPPPAKVAFQSPTNADLTSPEEDKPEITLTKDGTSSRSRLLLTKAILENVLSDLSQKNTALPAKDHQLSESEDWLTLPVDNTLLEIPNLDSNVDNTPQIDETHEDESDITTDEVFHKVIDILTPSANVAFQSPTNADLTSSEDDKPDIPLARDKTSSRSRLLLTKAILESVLSDLNQKHTVLPAKDHQLSESENLLNLPVDNTLSEIPNSDSSEDNTPQVDETHDKESDITTDEVFHKELDIPPPSDNNAFQSPTTADFTSPEGDKPDTLITLARDGASSRSKLLLTKAILESVLSDLSQKNTALPAKDHQLSGNEDLLTLPVDNTVLEIANLNIHEDNTSPLDETHDDESDITTHEVFRELDIPPLSDNGAFQLSTNADFTSNENDKHNIPLAQQRTNSRSRLLLTKAILENVLSDLSQENTALPAKATRVTSPSVLDKSTGIEQETSDDASKIYTDQILINASVPQIENFQFSNNTNDVLAELNETLSEIPSFNNSPVLPSEVETDLENNEKLYNSDDLSVSNDKYNSGMDDMLDKSSDSPPPLLPISEVKVQNVLPDSELMEYSLPGDKFLSISSTPDRAQVIDILDYRPSQLSVDKNPPKDTVFSEQPTDKIISEKPEDITLPELDDTILEIPDNQQNDKQNINENVLFENFTDGHTLPLPNEKIVTRGPSISKLLITKALLENVLSDLNARIYSSPIATTHLDKMRYNISPSFNTVANNPSQLLVDTGPEKEQNILEADEMLSDEMVDGQMLDDTDDTEENMSYPSSDLPSSNGDILYSDENSDKVGYSASKLLITKALLENVLSDINTRGFSLLSKDLPKKSVLDKTIYFVEPPLSEVIDETPSSPVDEGYHDYEPDTETYYVLTLPADNLEFDTSVDDSPMDQISNEILEAQADEEKGNIEDLASNTEDNDSSQEIEESLPLADDVFQETTRSKPYLGSKILITKALLEKVLSDINNGALSANSLPIVPVS
uniref:Uncharacterized protein n=1 Tax=Heliothis virescens TaxID=7102 RepID=A0A2A4JF11_HELVI